MLVICFCVITARRKEDGYSNLISLATDSAETGITFDYVEHMRMWEAEQETPLAFTAWKEQGGRMLSTTDQLKRAFDVTVVSISGSSENLIPYGKVLWEEDRDGCLIGAKTAEELFGSHEVEGLMICYDNRELVIRGVLKEPENILVFQETEKDAMFPRVNLRCSQRGESQRMTSHRMVAEKFKSRYGLNMVRIERRRKLPTFEELIELVPGKWSDFDGWKRNVAAWRSEREKAGGIPWSMVMD